MRNLRNRIFLSLYRLIWWSTRLALRGGHADRVLVVSTTGIGDTLFGTAALADLRSRRPEVRIAVLTSVPGAMVLDGNPDIDRIISTGRRFSLRTAWSVLRYAPATVLLFHNSASQNLLYVALSGCTEFHGIDDYGTKGLNDILTHRMRLPLRTSSVERRQLLVRQRFGGEPSTRDVIYRLSESERRHAEEWRQRLAARTVIGLQPFAKDFYKQWPYEYWVEYARALLRQVDCRFVIFGGRDDRRPQQHLLSLIEHAVRGPEDLRQAAAVLSQVDVLVTPDTGMIHIACALSIPTIGLFSPTDPQRTAPRSDTLRLLHVDNPCVGVPGLKVSAEQCFEKQCTMQFCMARIKPETVVRETLALLEASSTTHNIRQQGEIGERT